jgi:hypothetical protein
VGLFSVIDRLAGRFNRWFGGTAGASAGAGAQTGNPEVDMLVIKTVYPAVDHSKQAPEQDVGRTKKPEG